MADHDYLETSGLTPRAARVALLGEILAVVQGAGLPAWVIRSSSHPGPTIGVGAEHRAAALAALAAALPGPARHLQEPRPRRMHAPVVELTADGLTALDHCAGLRVAQFWISPDATLRYGMQYGTTIEFWEPIPEGGRLAPYLNTGAMLVAPEQLEPATITYDGAQWPSIALFDRTYLDEIDFPVDAVYTWVDSDDPRWQQRLATARAGLDETAHHPESYAPNRWASRDELRYSLRSLEMYAPWIRHVYLVTDRQVPAWLDRTQPGLTVIDHRDLFADPSVLPVFNSNAIISQLHRIDGLAEHYLYINDDSFFGRDVRPEHFFYGNGLAKVFPSLQTRPFGVATAADPTAVSSAKSMRELLLAGTGRTLSRAVRHTPYPQLRSVNAEIVERFPEVFTRTAASKFRHHDDVPLDQFFHYYAQATARAVPSTIGYNYFNVGQTESAERLAEFLVLRDRAVFTLNDAPTPGDVPLPHEEVQAFLESYFPFPSRFERRPRRAAAWLDRLRR